MTAYYADSRLMRPDRLGLAQWAFAAGIGNLPNAWPCVNDGTITEMLTYGPTMKLRIRLVRIRLGKSYRNGHGETADFPRIRLAAVYIRASPHGCGRRKGLPTRRPLNVGH